MQMARCESRFERTEDPDDRAAAMAAALQLQAIVEHHEQVRRAIREKWQQRSRGKAVR
jgi:hypothetical protein